VPIDVRVIATTNWDLTNALQKNRYRRDLFYRISVITIHVPPLRERREDICHLIDHFMTRFADTYGFRAGSLHQRVVDTLTRYSWPGNVRELENLVEQWFAMGRKESVSMTELPAEIVANVQGLVAAIPGADLSKIMSLRRAETELARRALEVAANNKSKAANLLGISRKKLYKLLNEDTSPEDQRPG
jgi:transcriptional regulator with PAS, ATPase and Fis domain